MRLFALCVAGLVACTSTDDPATDASAIADAAPSIDAGRTDVLHTDAGTIDALADSACVPGVSTLQNDLQDAAPNAGHVFGLDQRPTTTCRAFARPTGKVGDPFPQTLAATGCFTPADLREPVAGVIPYSVNAPLWSDGAQKRRFMALPDGAKIRIMPQGDLDLPLGTVLLKTFELGGKMLETRFLIRHDDGDWAGYTYIWDSDGKNAAALLGDETATRKVGFETWTFPSRSACLSCHTVAAGRSLGLEIGQLNGDYDYPGSRRANQIDTWEHIGLFETSPGPAFALTRFATPDQPTTGSLQARARAYLHANCSHCHRPDGLQTDGNLPSIDLRHTTALQEMNLINNKPVRGEFGIPGVQLVKPGFPLQSMLAVRMKTKVANVRMPAIGSNVVDDAGLALVAAWITSMTACP